MSNFKNIEKLGLSISEWGDGDKTSVVLAHELESILQSAQVVYEVENSAGINSWLHIEAIGAKSKAILLCVEPLKKKTKAEAALEFVKRYAELGVEDAETILKMKDEV